MPGGRPKNGLSKHLYRRHNVGPKTKLWEEVMKTLKHLALGALALALTSTTALAAEIRERFGIAIIFVTAQTDPATIERAKSVTHLAYINKPYSEQALLDALRSF